MNPTSKTTEMEKKMKVVAHALAALVLIAGAANAARPDIVPVPSTTLGQIEVPAGDVVHTKELAREGKAAGDKVSVGHIPASGLVDGPEGSK